MDSDGRRQLLGLNVTQRGPTTIVAPVGEIDLMTARTLYAQVVDQLRDDLTELVVDFSDVTFIDSTGLASLVKAARRLSSAGISVRITAASPHAVRVMTMTGVNRTIPVNEPT